MVTIPKIVRVSSVNSFDEPLVYELAPREGGTDVQVILVGIGDDTIQVALGDLVDAVEKLKALAALEMVQR